MTLNAKLKTMTLNAKLKFDSFECWERDFECLKCGFKCPIVALNAEPRKEGGSKC